MNADPTTAGGGESSSSSGTAASAAAAAGAAAGAAEGRPPIERIKGNRRHYSSHTNSHRHRAKDNM